MFTTTLGHPTHIDEITLAFLAGFGCIGFKHPPYSANLTLSGYLPVPLLKSLLGTQRFTSDADLKTVNERQVPQTGPEL